MGLNLLPNEARFQLEKMKFGKLVMRIVLITMTVWVVVVGVVMVVYWVKRLTAEKAQKTYDSLNTQFMSMSEGVEVNQKLRQKLKLASEILEKRFEYGAMFRTIANLFGDEVNLTDMKMKADKTYILQGEVNGGEMMDTVEKRVVEINEGMVDGATEAVLDQVSNIRDVWSFRLSVKLI